jgi:hypothetical protein
MKQGTIVATTLIVYVLVMLVAMIFSYGQVAIAQQASPPPGIPSADNLRNFTNSTGTNMTAAANMTAYHAGYSNLDATPLGIPSDILHGIPPGEQSRWGLSNPSADNSTNLRNSTNIQAGTGMGIPSADNSTNFKHHTHFYSGRYWYGYSIS